MSNLVFILTTTTCISTKYADIHIMTCVYHTHTCNSYIRTFIQACEHTNMHTWDLEVNILKVWYLEKEVIF